MYMYNRWSLIYISFIYIEHFFYNLLLRYTWKRKGGTKMFALQPRLLWLGGISASSPDGFRRPNKSSAASVLVTHVYLLFRFVLRETHTNNDFHESEHFRTVDKLCVEFDVCNIELLTFENSFVGFAPNGISVKWQLARSHSILLWKHTHCRVCLSLLWP